MRSGDGDTIIVDSASGLLGPDSHGRTLELIGTAGQEAAGLSSSPKLTTFMMRRSSAGVDGHTIKTTIPVRANFDELKQHLKHLGPSNPATNPKNTRSTTVKVKPGHVILPPRPASVAEGLVESHYDEGDETTSLLRPQVSGKDGIQILAQTYGSTSPVLDFAALSSQQEDTVPSSVPTPDTVEQSTKSTQTPSKAARAEPGPERPGKRSSSSGGSTHSFRADSAIYGKQAYVRSGSITENVVESRGVRKVVLETTSSNDDDEFAVITALPSPEQTKTVPKKPESSFTTKDGASDQLEEEDEEGVLSPDAGDEGPSGKGEAGDQQGDASGSGAGKKKSRRKKRKGGKS